MIFNHANIKNNSGLMMSMACNTRQGSYTYTGNTAQIYNGVHFYVPGTYYIAAGISTQELAKDISFTAYSGCTVVSQSNISNSNSKLCYAEIEVTGTNAIVSFGVSSASSGSGFMTASCTCIGPTELMNNQASTIIILLNQDMHTTGRITIHQPIA